jgi:hypothetical protein
MIGGEEMVFPRYGNPVTADHPCIQPHQLKTVYVKWTLYHMPDRATVKPATKAPPPVVTKRQPQYTSNGMFILFFQHSVVKIVSYFKTLVTLS